MTDFASLQIEIDSKQATQAAGDLDKLSAAGKRTQVTVEQAERYMRKASVVLGDMAKQERAAAAGADALAKASRGAGVAASEMARDAQRAAAGTKLAGHHVQNLAFQANDLFVGLASGQKPMTVFMQQGTQIAQIMAQAGVGVGGLAKAVGGMAVGFVKAYPVIALAAAALGTAAVAAKIFAAQLNDQRRAELDAYANSLGLTKEELEELGPLTITVGDVIKGLGKTFVEELGINIPSIAEQMKEQLFSVFDAVMSYSRVTTSSIYAAYVGTFNGIKETWKALPGVLGEAAIGAANLVIKALNFLLQKGTQYINAWSSALNSVMSAIPGFDGMKIGTLTAPQISEMSNQFSGAGKAAAGAFINSYRDAFNQAEGAQKRIGQALADNTVAAAKDRFKSAAEAEGFLDPEDAKKAGAKAGKKMAKSWIDQLNEDLWKGIAGVLDDTDKIVADMAKGWGKEFEGILEEIGKVEAGQAGWNEQIERTVALLDQLGTGTGKTLGSIMLAFQGLKTGDFSGISGPAGVLLNTIGNIQWTGTKDGERYIYKLGEEIFNALDGIFGGGGRFEQTMNNLFQGAATGSAFGAILGGGKSGAFGSLAGGMLGQVAGKELLGKALGDFAGPVGAIAGAVIGNLLGGLLSSTPRGKATFSGGTDYSLSGNSSSRRAAAGSLAGGAVDALQQIADALGVTLGGFTGTIGIRKDSLRYDPTGSGITKTSKGALDFGQDEAALLEALVADAIRDGAFQGLSEGMKAYLTSGDLEQRLQNVLSFQGVFDELAQRKDPKGYELGQLDKWRTAMGEIFTDIGATTEQFAQLEELTALKRLEIIEQFTEDAVSFERERRALEIQIMEMEGKTAEALAAARALELEEADASLRPLMQRIYALQDEQAAAQEAAAAAQEAARLAEEAAAAQRAIAQERYGLETRLLQLQGDIATLRQRELDALDPTNRALQQQIYDMQDAAVAAQELAQAQAEAARAAEELAAQERAIAQERYGLETRLLQLQGDVAALRERELEALAPANRALLETIFALEDTQAAAAVAAQAAEEAAAAQIRAAEELAAKTQAIADERYSIETRLLQVLGDTAQLRERELAALDPSNRALQQQIYALEDAAEAAQVLAEAQAEAARVAEEAAAAERALREERAAIARQNFATTIGLMADIAELEGRTRDALILRRNEEARAMDASLHPLLARKFALEDEALAAQQAAQAAEEAARAAQELAAKMQAIAQERYQLETRLLTLQGDTAELRRRELEELDPSNRALLRQIHALEDQQAAAAAMVDQNNALIQSYNSSASSIESLRDRFAGFASDIRLYRASLFGDTAVSARSNFSRIASMAALGDEASLQGFTGAADAYLAEARNSARTLVDYRRAVGLVAGAADKAAAGADGVVRMAEAQLAGIQSSVMQLQALNAQIEADSKIAQDQAAEQLRQAQEIERAQDDTVEVIEAGTDMLADRLAEVASALAEIKAQLASDGASERVENTAMVVSLGRIDDLLRGVEEGGTLRVSGVSDLPVYTEAAP